MQTLYHKWLRNWMIIFFTILLPEIVTRRNDVCLDDKQKNYCICNRPCFKPMIDCDRPNCKVEWYHYACVWKWHVHQKVFSKSIYSKLLWEIAYFTLWPKVWVRHLELLIRSSKNKKLHNKFHQQYLLSFRSTFKASFE